MHWHVFILDLFRPFVLPINQHAFKSAKPLSKSPEAIFAASIAQLKRLILLYFKTSLWSEPCVMVSVALVYIANAVLKDRSNPEWRFYYLLCMRGYQSIIPLEPILEDMVKGLLAVAVEEGAMSSAETYAISKIVFSRADRALALAQRQQEFIVVDLDRALFDRSAAGSDTLAQRFERISLHEEQTSGIF